METITTSWTGVAALGVLLAFVLVLYFLLRKGRLQTDDLPGIAKLVEKISGAIEGLGETRFIGLFADYAAKAVRVVEQLVKNGEIPKDNTLRKQKARDIIERLALADGVDEDDIFDNDETIGNLIEAAVNDMQKTDVKIELGSEEAVKSPPEAE